MGDIIPLTGAGDQFSNYFFRSALLSWQTNIGGEAGNEGFRI
jgi:hypothetical protein